MAGGFGVTMYKGDGTAHQTGAGSASLGVNAAAIGSGDVKGTGPLLVTFDARTVVLWSITTGLGLESDGGADVSQLVTGAVGKLDSDNFADIAVGRLNGIIVFRGGSAGLSPVITTPMVERTGALAIGDVNGDGVADLAYTQVDPASDSSLVGLMPGAGAAAFLAPITVPAMGVSQALQLADVDAMASGHHRRHRRHLVAARRPALHDRRVRGTGSRCRSRPGQRNLHGRLQRGRGADLIVTNTGTQTITIFESTLSHEAPVHVVSVTWRPCGHIARPRYSTSQCAAGSTPPPRLR